VKKILIALLLAGSLAGPAEALPGFLELFTTDGYNTNPKTVFTDEPPFVYMKLELPPGAFAVTGTGWNAPGGTAYFGTNMEFGQSVERWDTAADWESIKEAGTWKVYANYFDSTGVNRTAHTEFTFVPGSTAIPEPATFILLLGGLVPLSVSRKRLKISSDPESWT
jgi:hypothetical protein